MGPIWLMRMYQWAKNPPSANKVKLVLLVVALCFALWGLEMLGLWPQALTLAPPVKP